MNFIKTGDPNGAGLTAWPRMIPKRGAHMAFDEQSFHAAGPLRTEPCNLTDQL